MREYRNQESRRTLTYIWLLAHKKRLITFLPVYSHFVKKGDSEGFEHLPDLDCFPFQFVYLLWTNLNPQLL